MRHCYSYIVTFQLRSERPGPVPLTVRRSLTVLERFEGKQRPGLPLSDNSAVVMVNNKIVKSLTPCPSGNSGQTFSQHIVLQSSLLSPTGGNNRLEIMRVQEGAGGSDQFDDFAVRDIVCFFKQSA